MCTFCVNHFVASYVPAWSAGFYGILKPCKLNQLNCYGTIRECYRLVYERKHIIAAVPMYFFLRERYYILSDEQIIINKAFTT
jgi:hypothetical protein